ncbi:hypothetical protein EVAR_8060_1 [Eumeta japonica]|uniref:Uncharacterized protein n=1 Tax=Eumeta variegata TaxID=151549 RepID=A0A4C1TJT4_EUMVA|nr:hypothetical protein EVAR_8060_1 [Eumeta japonica]
MLLKSKPPRLTAEEAPIFGYIRLSGNTNVPKTVEELAQSDVWDLYLNGGRAERDIENAILQYLTRFSGTSLKTGDELTLRRRYWKLQRLIIEILQRSWTRHRSLVVLATNNHRTDNHLGENDKKSIWSQLMTNLTATPSNCDPSQILSGIWLTSREINLNKTLRMQGFYDPKLASFNLTQVKKK